MNVTGEEPLTVDGVRVRLEGDVDHVGVTVARRAVTLRGSRGDAVGDVLANSGFRVSAAVDLEIPQRSVRSAERNAGGPARFGTARNPMVVLDAPELEGDEIAQVALVEEDGELRWLLPTTGQRHFVLDVDTDSAVDRGIIGTVARKAIRFLAVKAVKPLAGQAVRSLAAAAEARLRPTRVRTFTPDNFRRDDDEAPNAKALGDGPALLIIHGTNSRTDQAFGSFDVDWVRRLHNRYAGRVIAFDHPTLSVGPDQNADAFFDWVEANHADAAPLRIDILAHSRGGLVARELAAAQHPKLDVRSIVFVATPNAGTPLCDTEHLVDFVDAFTNLAAVVPDNPITDALEIVFELVKDIALEIAYDSLPGVQSMNPSGRYLHRLNGIDGIDGAVLDDRDVRREPPVLRAIAADFEPLSSSSRLVKLRDRLFDRVFDGAMNDLIVPTRSVYLQTGRFHVAADQRLVVDSSHGVDHCSFWEHASAVRQLDDWLRPDWRSHPPASVDEHDADPTADIESAIETADEAGFTSALAGLADLPQRFAGFAEQISGGPVSASASPTKPLGTVVLLPGIMGSILDTAAGRVWISPGRLSRGAFAELSREHPAGQVFARGLNPAYAPIAARLSASWKVHLFPFDWRLDLADSADALNEFITNVVWAGSSKKQRTPVHLVAHSMGGLVARTFIGRHGATWNAMDDRGATRPSAGGRLVMLGTPNRGSYAIPLALAGQDMAVKGLAAIDLRHSTADLSRVMATFPGMYQMLPAPDEWSAEHDHDDDRARLYEAGAWGQTPVSPELLTNAARHHRWLESADVTTDGARMVYVAGDRQLTPARIRIENEVQHFGRHDRGDGRVLHSSGRLEGVQTYFVDASHGALITDASVLEALDGLLLTGTSSLNDGPLPRRGFDTGDTTTATPIAASMVDPDPARTNGTRGASDTRHSSRDIGAVIAQSLSPYVGSTHTKLSPERALRISVTHASLEQARHPVIVGHYAGLPPQGAEKFLDGRLGQAFTQHHELDDYPRAIGESLFVDAQRTRPPGGIVLGLGPFGGLSRSKLARAVKRAVIQRVLRAHEMGASGVVGVTSVLISTPGSYGLSIGSSIAAVVEGAAEALRDLGDMELGDIRFEELEIIELYEVWATQALEQVSNVYDMLPVELRAAVALTIDSTLASRRGGRPGLPTFNPAGDGWPRFVVDRHLPPCLPSVDPDRLDDNGYPCGDGSTSPQPTLPRLEFTRLGRGAQTDRLSVDFDSDKVDAMIRAAVGNPLAVDETFALFEMLFPHEEKLEIDNTDNLHLLVDEDTAAIPWELLCGRGDGSPAQALAMRSGLLRQVRPSAAGAVMRRTGRPPVGNQALVVGDPPLGLQHPRLPGARREAEEVARLLEVSGYEVERLIFDDNADEDRSWMRIQTALYAHPYRVIHFATHGEIDDERPERTGLLIGGDQRLTAVDIRQMSVTPDFVFLNACHVGRTGSAMGGGRSQDRVNELAAHLGLQLMRNGVRAVVAAGWAVDDQAALVFASKLYELLLGGQHYGIAVHEARKATFGNGRSNTWGAYQCYGDPSFALQTGEGSGSQRVPVSQNQLIQQLDVLTAQAGDVADLERLHATHQNVIELDDRDVARFPHVEVYEALGRAYAELGCCSDAVWAYREASRVDEPKGKMSLTALEQLSNMEAFLAVGEKLTRSSPLAAHHPNIQGSDELFDDAEHRIQRLIDFGETSERLCLLASTFKKRAASRDDAQGRRADARKSRDAYRKAFERSFKDQHFLDPYSGLIWIQMSRVCSPNADLVLERKVLALIARKHLKLETSIGDRPVALEALSKALAGNSAALERLRDEVPDEHEDWSVQTPMAHRTLSEPPPDFWTDLAPADLEFTRAFLDTNKGDDQTDVLEKVRERYGGTFANRSTIRKRHSVMQHVADLAALMPAARRQPYEQLAQQLDRF